jgi:hypothetical protein
VKRAAPIERTAVPYLPIQDGLYSRRLNLVPLISDRIRRPPNPQDAVKILSRWGRICNRFVPIIAPEGILNGELKSKALAEVTKNLRDAMGTEDDDDTSGVFAIYEEVPAGHWANGGKILPLSELLKEMGGDVSEERKCEIKALFDGRAALKKHFGIPK